MTSVSLPFSGQPRTLQDLCRIKIRHCIGLQSLKLLEDLPIAKVMKDYLKHKFDSMWRNKQWRGWVKALCYQTMQSLSGRKVHRSVLFMLKENCQFVFSLLFSNQLWKLLKEDGETPRVQRVVGKRKPHLTPDRIFSTVSNFLFTVMCITFAMCDFSTYIGRHLEYFKNIFSALKFVK